MKTRITRSVVAAVLAAAIVFGISKPSEAAKLPKARVKVAETIAKICEDNWDKYGIWPSVAIGQAFIESILGKGPNLFGVIGHASRPVYESTIGYLETLQNQYFRGEADFAESPEEQLAIIMEGGRYCEEEYPYGDYYNNVIGSINKYGWRVYDRNIEQRITKEKEDALREQRQEGLYKIEYAFELDEGTAIADPEYVKQGSVILCERGTFEVIGTKEGLQNRILIGAPEIYRLTNTEHRRNSAFDFLERLEIYIDVVEDTKG